MAPALGAKVRRRAQSGAKAPRRRARESSITSAIAVAIPSVLSREDTAPSPFFNLPRELRDMVYDGLWQEKPAFVARYNSQTFQVTYHGAPTSPLEVVPDLSNFQGHLPWILSNKQLCLESIDQLQRCSDWLLLPEAHAPQAARKSKPPVSSSALKSLFTLSPWHACSLDMGTFSLREYLQLSSDNRTSCSQILLPTCCDNLLRTLRAGIPHLARLKHLQFGLQDGCFNHGNVVEEAEAALDLLRVGALPNLKQVDITVKFGHRFLNNKVLQSTLNATIEELGTNLIGPPWVMQDSVVGATGYHFQFTKA